MMNLILNHNVVALSPPSLPAFLYDLINWFSKYTADKIRIRTNDCLPIRAVLVGLRGPNFNERIFFRNHFQPVSPFSGYSGWSIASPPISCPAEGLEWAAKTSSVSVGAPHTVYGCDLSFGLKCPGVMGSHYGTLMLTSVAHFTENDLLRWLFVKCFNDVWTTPGNMGIRFVDQNNHCKYGPKCPCSDSQLVIAPLVLETRNKPAQFRPGVRFAGERYARLVAHVLKTAYGQSRFSQKDQDRFTVDIGVNVGASSGVVTKNVRIYITPQNEIHIRPTEDCADACSQFEFPLDR